MTNKIENERIAVLETLLEIQTEKLDKMEFKVSQMHDIIMQLRGIKWFGLTIAAALGFMISKFEAFLNIFPNGRP
jgi:hypothetical protein